VVVTIQCLKNQTLIRKSIRVRLGLRQIDVAKKLGRSESYTHRVEAGKIRPKPKEARTWARLLKCSVAEIFPDLKKVGGR